MRCWFSSQTRNDLEPEAFPARTLSRFVLITSESRQALDLIGKVLLSPGDHMLVERPTCLDARRAWSAGAGARLAPRKALRL